MILRRSEVSEMDKDLDYYMGLDYRMEVYPEGSEHGFAVSFPELPGCVTCADTMKEALNMVEDAKRAWLADALEEGDEIPEPNTYSGQFKLRLPKDLHRELAIKAKCQGISMNQYCVYLLTKMSS